MRDNCSRDEIVYVVEWVHSLQEETWLHLRNVLAKYVEPSRRVGYRRVRFEYIGSMATNTSPLRVPSGPVESRPTVGAAPQYLET